jgi:hypothetical protein
MKTLPYGGGTFPDRQISEDGRQHALRLLEALSSRQLTDLFTSARVTTYDGISVQGRRVESWVEVFQDKVRQIRAGGPCPLVNSQLSTPNSQADLLGSWGLETGS